jgi:serine/threonine protein kinase
MGAVYRARDTRLGRTVAIEVLHGRFTDRSEREARSLAALNHPHICALYDIGPDYLVMEFIEGKPSATQTFGPTGEPSALSSDSQVIGRSQRALHCPIGTITVGA